MNKTIWKLIGAFLLVVVLNLPGALQPLFSLFRGFSAPLAIIIVAEAWAQSATQGPPETTTPAQQEETTQLPQGQGGPPVSAPSTTSPEEQKPAAEQPKQGPPSPTIVDTVHGELSKSIFTTATWLDSFFGDSRYASELNPSYIRFRYNVFLENRSALLLKPDLDARFVLPQLREKAQIVISGTPREENEFSAVQSSTAADSSVITDERGVMTGLQYAARQTPSESFVVRTGLKAGMRSNLRAGPLYRVLVHFPSGWSLRFIEDILWRSIEGWKYTTTVDLERPLPHNLFFRTSTEWVHTEHVNGFTYAVSFSLSHPLNSNEALQYSWVNVFQTRPVHELTEIALRVSYRKLIWRNWLYYEVTPQYRFPRDRGFEATPGILFRLDMLFGKVTR